MRRLLHSRRLIGGALLLTLCACNTGTEDGAAASTSSTSPAITETSETTSSTTDGSTSERPATSESSSTSQNSTTNQSPTTIRRSTTSATAAGKAVADGSGCTPGPGPLPDGTWYGYVVASDETGFSFDLACFFTGEQAVAAATEDGAEAPPPNDYHIRNVNTQVRELSVQDGSRVTWYPDFGDPTSESTATYPEWIAAVDGRGIEVGIWVEISGGRVESITEQWVP